MRRALTYVEWIEQKTIKADRNTLTAEFGINDKSKFSLDDIKEALPSKYRQNVTVVSGP